MLPMALLPKDQRIKEFHTCAIKSSLRWNNQIVLWDILDFYDELSAKLRDYKTPPSFCRLW